MKTVTIAPRAKTLQNLLRQARPGGLILQAPDGQRYVLAPLKNWVGFEVGESADFAEEVKKTARNKKLMNYLARRRTRAKPVPLAEVRRKLGLKSNS